MQMDIKGVGELLVELRRLQLMNGAKEALIKNGNELNEEMTRQAVFVRGYSTGQTRRSIETIGGDNEVRVRPTTEYSPYLEHGTRKMSAQPFVGPAWRVQKEKFKEDLRKLVSDG